MLNTILVNLDKTLEKTSFRSIYQKESRTDEIQFLIDSDLSSLVSTSVFNKSKYLSSQSLNSFSKNKNSLASEISMQNHSTVFIFLHFNILFYFKLKF